MTEKVATPIPASDGSPWRSDKHLWWLLLLALAGLVIYLAKDKEVFPSASIDLNLPKEQILSRAEFWAQTAGFDLSNKAAANPNAQTAIMKASTAGGTTQESPPARSFERANKPLFKTVVFTYDNSAKTFLEYELGGKKANELMKEKIPVWSWRARFCREFQQEEMRVWLNPKGELSSFDRYIENDRAMPSIDQKEAERMAREFVEKEVGKPLTNYKLIRHLADSRPKRVDHYFTFEDTTEEFKGARLRMAVGISGNTVSQYSNYLYVPETWERKFSTIRSHNRLLGSAAGVFHTLLSVVAGFIFFWGVMTGNVRWRFAALAALFYTFFPIADQVNNFAEFADDYVTRISWNEYMSGFWLGLLRRGISEFITAFGMFAAAEIIYRIVWPKHVAAENMFSLKGLGTNPILIALVVGYVLFLIDLGWVSTYYLLGERLGFWCPLGVDNYQVLSSYAPAFSAMHIGVIASSMEEALYRVIAMGLVYRITKNFWVANLFQAVTWGFAHSTYPQQPAYSRGVELTIGGLLDGWILKRYGLVACLVAHYLFDTFLGCKPLFGSPDLTLKLSAVAGMLPFAVMFLIGLKRKRDAARKGDQAPDLANEALPVHIKSEEEEPALASDEEAVSYQPMPKGKRNFLLLASAICIACSLLINPKALSDDATNKIKRAQAVEIGNRVMLDHGINPGGWNAVASLSDQASLPSNQYLFEKVKLKRTDELIKLTHSGGYVWRIRYFKPMEADEYEVQLDGQGREVGFDISLAEDATGARLSKDDALRLAERELARTYSYLSPYRFDAASDYVRKNRTDWSFTYRIPQFDAGEAPFKFTMSVIGDKVSGATWYWDVPDTWTIERTKHTLKDQILKYVWTAFSVIGSIAVVFWAFGVLRSGTIRWRSALLFGLFFITLEIPELLNALPGYYRGYSTTEALWNYGLTYSINIVKSLVWIFGSTSMLAAFALATIRILFPRERLSSLVLVLTKPANDHARRIRRDMWVDGIIAAVAYLSILTLVSSLSSLALFYFSPNVLEASLSTVSSFQNVIFPPADTVKDAVVEGVRNVLMAAIAAGIFAKYFPKRLYFFGAMIIFVGVSALGQKYPQDMAVDFVAGCLRYTLFYLFIARVAGKNIIAYLMAGALSTLTRPLFTIYQHGMPLMLPDLVIGSLLALAPIGYAVYLAIRDRELPSEAEAQKIETPA